MLNMRRDLYLIRVVDDDKELLEAIRFALECMDWRVITYSSANEFLENEQFIKPGCIILDINMPDVDGLQLQKLLNEHENPLPIIFLTGHGSMNSAISAFRNGAFDFLQKPFEPEELLADIEKAMKHSEAEYLERQRASATNRWRSLTEKQIEVAKDLIAGLKSSAIAEHLGISERTLQRHRQNVFHKLGIKKVGELKEFQRSLLEEKVKAKL